MARSGALDQALITGDTFYSTDYTQSLLFISDGNYLATWPPSNISRASSGA